jgi:hypothetical protein
MATMPESKPAAWFSLYWCNQLVAQVWWKTMADAIIQAHPGMSFDLREEPVTDPQILNWLESRFNVRTTTNYVEHRDQLEISFAIPGIFGEEHAESIGTLREIVKTGMEYRRAEEERHADRD